MNKKGLLKDGQPYRRQMIFPRPEADNQLQTLNISVDYQSFWKPIGNTKGPR